MSELLPVVLPCVVVFCIVGSAVGRTFASHRKELAQLRQLINTLNHCMTVQSERIAAIESSQGKQAESAE